MVVLLCVAYALLAAADRLVWQPHTDPDRRTDAVVVLGGSNNPARLALGARLAAAYGAPLWVSSGATRHYACTGPDTQLPDGSHCFVPPQFTTQGEARTVRGLVARYGWRSVTVVVSVEQVERARLRFRRCSVPGLRVTAVPLAYKSWLYVTAYELAAGFKAELWQRGC